MEDFMLLAMARAVSQAPDFPGNKTGYQVWDP